MSLRRIACILCLLCCAALLRAQTALQDPKQAKALFDKASSEAANQVQQVRDFCSAADLDVKDKQYAGDCHSARSALLMSDRRSLQVAQDAFAKGDWAKTISLAKYVSSYDPDLFKQAADLAERAKAAQQKGATQ